ncbi:unnamed protein product, partial [marine sediment metagenome]
GLVIETLRDSGSLDLEDFYSLPSGLQSLQLEHTLNKMRGAYKPRRKK